jgi:hypothetical protein
MPTRGTRRAKQLARDDHKMLSFHGLPRPWKPKKLGTVVAERVFTLKANGRRTGTLRVQVGMPVRSPERTRPETWWCPIKIGRQMFVSPGADALQALILGLYQAARLLPALARSAGGDPEWLGEKERLIFVRSFLHQGLSEALHEVVGGMMRAVETLADRPGKVRREGRKIINGLFTILDEAGL